LRERLDTTRNLLGTRALTLSPQADEPPSAKPLPNRAAYLRKACETTTEFTVSHYLWPTMRLSTAFR
jgi:hypothetical protein